MVSEVVKYRSFNGASQEAEILKGVYETIRCTMELINAKIEAGGKPTKLFIDRNLQAVGLVERDELGRYAIAPLDDFVGL